VVGAVELERAVAAMECVGDVAVGDFDELRR
jgi:hypothetical protein